MKKIYLITALILISAQLTFGESYIVSISGIKYMPDMLNVITGDKITIYASETHPLVQVDRHTWYTNGNTPMVGGWGTKTSNYTFGLSVADTIYYVCKYHVGSGMKGMIIVDKITGIDDNQEKFTMLLYPNPAKDFLSIRFENNSDLQPEITLYSILGENLNDKTNISMISGSSNEYQVNISNLSRGTYIVLIGDGDIRRTMRFFKN